MTKKHSGGVQSRSIPQKNPDSVNMPSLIKFALSKLAFVNLHNFPRSSNRLAVFLNNDTADLSTNYKNPPQFCCSNDFRAVPVPVNICTSSSISGALSLPVSGAIARRRSIFEYLFLPHTSDSCTATPVRRSYMAYVVSVEFFH